MTQTSLETWCCKYAYWYCFWIISEFSLEIISKLDLLILTITRLQSPHLSFRGPRFELMASGTLELTDIGDSIGNYDLQLTSGADVTTCELPLFGVFCLRLACQPECLVEPVATGYLNLLVCSLHYFFHHIPPPSLSHWLLQSRGMLFDLIYFFPFQSFILNYLAYKYEQTCSNMYWFFFYQVKRLNTCHCTLGKITHTCLLWVSGWGESQALLVCVKEPLAGLLVLKGRYGGHRATAANTCYQGNSHRTNCHFYSCLKLHSVSIHQF